MGLAFAFLATFTYTKMAHALFIPGNAYFRSLEAKGTLEPVDFEDEDLETMGVRCLEEFTWIFTIRKLVFVVAVVRRIAPRL